MRARLKSSRGVKRDAPSHRYRSRQRWIEAENKYLAAWLQFRLPVRGNDDQHAQCTHRAMPHGRKPAFTVITNGGIGISNKQAD